MVGVTGAVSPVLHASFHLSLLTRRKAKVMSNRRTARLFRSFACMGFPMVFGDRSASVSSRICTELQLGVEWFG